MGEEEQELQVPAGVSLEDLIRLAELMQPAQAPSAAAEAGAELAPRDDQRVLRLAEYLLSKVTPERCPDFDKRPSHFMCMARARARVRHCKTQAVKDIH